VARVGAQGRPHNQEHRERAGYCCGKDDRDGLRGRLGIVTEDVMNLGFGGVAQRRLGNGERDVRIAGHGEVEDLALVGFRGTERSNDDGGGDRFRGSEELVGQVFLGLSLLAGLRWLQSRRYAYQIHLCLSAVLYVQDEGLLQPSGWVSQRKESLMRSLRTLAIDGREKEFQGIGGAQGH
jgi:hypothetical protein